MEHVMGNIFFRTAGEPMAEGAIVETHAHNFDHVTFIVKGRMKIEQLEPIDPDESPPTKFRTVQTVEKAAYAYHPFVLIKKGVWHRLTSLEDHSMYYCVYSHRRPDTGEVVEEYTGWREAVT